MTRQAKCTYCKEQRPSDPNLAFFEDRTEGSAWALNRCGICAYSPIAHQPEVAAKRHLRGQTMHTFVQSVGADLDAFYCGCRGWD